jgi:hypothetical protein
MAAANKTPRRAAGKNDMIIKDLKLGNQVSTICLKWMIFWFPVGGNARQKSAVFEKR